MKPHELYRPILKIPEGSCGAFRVRHLHVASGARLNTANLRCMALGGQPSEPVRFRKPVHFHELSEHGGVWMTDKPDEQAQANRLVSGLRGTVLVGGLGLGYGATRLAQQPQVDNVVIVERSEEVIRLVWRHLPRRERLKMDLVHDDLFAFLRRGPLEHECPRTYDHAYYDIWGGDGEDTFFHYVVPLLQLSIGRVGFRPRCWNEDVMRGQLRYSLLGLLGVPLTHLATAGHTEYTGNIFHDWKVPFVRWLLAKPRTAPARMREANRYVRTFGERPLPEELLRLCQPSELANQADHVGAR